MKKRGLITLIIVLSVAPLGAQKTYKADAASTVITWEGKKIGKTHTGSVNLKEGWITVEKNAFTGGEFVVDMTSIKDLDLKDDKMRGMLEGHLKSDDFFGVEKYPESKLVITGSDKFVNGSATVKGNLTVKEATHPVEFTANESIKGKVITYTAVITFDRSLYDVRYGSGKFFSNIGDAAINDEIPLSVTLVVEK